jgi:hypothetical protein
VSREDYTFGSIDGRAVIGEHYRKAPGRGMYVDYISQRWPGKTGEVKQLHASAKGSKNPLKKRVDLNLDIKVWLTSLFLFNNDQREERVKRCRTWQDILSQVRLKTTR